MTLMSDTIEQIKLWDTPKPATYHGDVTPFPLSCHISEIPASKQAVSRIDVGPDLEMFWSISNEAELFKDEVYGQWGLRIFSPEETLEVTNCERENSPDDLKQTDYVIGLFYGDSDQLIIESDVDGMGKYDVVVRNAVEERREWPRVASSFGEFLRDYVKFEGMKFWEN